MSSRIVDGTSNTISVPELDQSSRDGRLDTPLGPNKLALKRFHGVEGISELFEYQIEALSTERNLDFDLLLGKACCVTLRTYLGVKRHYHGVVTEGQWIGTESKYYVYRLVLRPWIWLLGRKANCRIFKDKNAFEIVQQILKEAGITDYEPKINGSELEKLEYCVQYRETDLSFISRLMEEWGIYYFFEHSADKHKLVITNQRSAHVRIDASAGAEATHPDNPLGADNAYRSFFGKQYLSSSQMGSFPFIPRHQRSGLDLQHLSAWTSARAFRTSKMSLNDFDYAKPSAKLEVSKTTEEKYDKSKWEVYDYPGRYLKPEVGERLAKIRLQAEQAADRRRYATGHAASLYPGGLFDFTNHEADDAKYLVLQATHSFAQQTYDSGQGRGSDQPYQGQYVVMRDDRQYRAPLVTPRPLIMGPQTAMVTDEDGDKKSQRGKGKKWIDVDKQGRILVHFHWDRATSSPLNTSRRVRVAQMWSGKEWGWQVIPRVGQEVVVTFLEGDPDQPLVVGTVYNEEYKFPYALPANETISGVKTETQEGEPGYNELIFEDKKDLENIRMHAQRFHEITVRQKETRTIGIANNDTAVARETTIEHGHDNLTLKHGDQVTLLKLGDQKTTLEKGDQSTELKMGNQSTLLKMGDQSTKLNLGSQSTEVSNNINTKAHLGIVIECGQSKITMTPASIKIESLMIEIDGKAMTQVKGSAMVTVKGGIVMIN